MSHGGFDILFDGSFASLDDLYFGGRVDLELNVVVFKHLSLVRLLKRGVVVQVLPQVLNNCLSGFVLHHAVGFIYRQQVVVVRVCGYVGPVFVLLRRIENFHHFQVAALLALAESQQQQQTGVRVAEKATKQDFFGVLALSSHIVLNHEKRTDIWVLFELFEFLRFFAVIERDVMAVPENLDCASVAHQHTPVVQLL